MRGARHLGAGSGHPSAPGAGDRASRRTRETLGYAKDSLAEGVVHTDRLADLQVLRAGRRRGFRVGRG